MLIHLYWHGATERISDCDIIIKEHRWLGLTNAIASPMSTSKKDNVDGCNSCASQSFHVDEYKTSSRPGVNTVHVRFDGFGQRLYTNIAHALSFIWMLKMPSCWMTLTCSDCKFCAEHSNLLRPAVRWVQWILLLILMRESWQLPAQKVVRVI